MKREIIITSDGSSTIHLPEINEHYHSKHGAIQEAYHVFIERRLKLFSSQKNLSLLEIGFGTGLNCFISYLESKNTAQAINYTAIEAYPVKKQEWVNLNYVLKLNAQAEADIFNNLHLSKWGQAYKISSNFSLIKRQQLIEEIDDRMVFDLIYFDAFGARVQPELWTENIFKKMYLALNKGGVLVTYSAKGSVRRAMQVVGFTVERLEGPPGKRHMLRATKE